jgi:hypothetical protein
MTVPKHILFADLNKDSSSFGPKQPNNRRLDGIKSSFAQVLKAKQAKQATFRPYPSMSQDIGVEVPETRRFIGPSLKSRHPIHLPQQSMPRTKNTVLQAKGIYEAMSARSNPLTARGPGHISAHFESGDVGPGAIGFDPMAGTSYGTYQIASRPGTMNAFIRYLEEKAPSYAVRLKNAGPANTGGRIGRMPAVWQQLAQEDPMGFERLQRDFIEQTHYLPACEAIKERTGVDIATQPLPIQEAVFSTAVQHGPQGAANIWEKAVKNRKVSSPQMLIQNIYTERMKRFRSSPLEVRRAVALRLAQERSVLMASLRQGYLMGKNNLVKTPG